METQGIFSALQKTFSGLSHQMRRLEVISENISNAESLPDENGKIYQRKVVQDGAVAEGRRRSFGDEMSLRLRGSNNRHVTHSKGPAATAALRSQQGDLEIVEVDGEKLVHDPNHPRADKDGYVRMPNVNVVEEMVDLMAASRAYEANVSVLRAAKNMAKQTFEI